MARARALGLHVLAALTALAAPRLLGDLVQAVEEGTTRAHVDPGNLVQKHVLTHLYEYVVTEVEEIAVETPYGPPSDALVRGRFPGREAIATFLKVKLPMIEVMDFRKGGYLPEALINYMALLGWSPGDDREVLPFDELVAAGVLDGYVDCISEAHGAWDHAGGSLICREAGAVVVDCWDRDLFVLDHEARRTPIAAATPELPMFDAAPDSAL